MAPQSRKRKSEAMEDTVGAVTPTGSPTQKKLRITQSQKQALIDNLQLEITERARHLRAHYALQCADLRARIERRVNRVPMAMRKMTIGELMAKHQDTAPNQPKQAPTQSFYAQATTDSNLNRPLPAIPVKSPLRSSPVKSHLQPPASKSKKRKSSTINIASDKENENEIDGPDTLPMPKNNKRTKTIAPAAAAPQPPRAASRAGVKQQPSVLSPRSHNSRTLPRSPIKDYPINPASPTKSMIARPISPLKPASPFKSAASAATSAISASVHGMIEHAKRGTAATAGKLSRTTSREKQTGAVIAGSVMPLSNTTTTTTIKGRMLPPPRPVLANFSPQRTASQSSNHSTASEMSSMTTTTTNTTVVTKPKRGRAATKKDQQLSQSEAEKKSPVATTKRGMASKAASAAKTALKRNATTANKKVIVAEPALGKRVLRKRN